MRWPSQLSAIHPRYEPGKELRLEAELVPLVIELAKAARAAGETMRAGAAKANEDAIALMEKNGVKLIRPEREPFEKAVAGVHKYFSTMVANAPDSLCSRVAHVCGFTGPAVAVQTACSTGAVAVHQACQSLLNFESDLAIDDRNVVNTLRSSHVSSSPRCL